MKGWFLGFERPGSEKVRTKHAVSDRRERERSEQACESEKLSSVPPQARSDYMPCLKISGNKGQGSAEIPRNPEQGRRAQASEASQRRPCDRISSGPIDTIIF